MKCNLNFNKSQKGNIAMDGMILVLILFIGGILIYFMTGLLNDWNHQIQNDTSVDQNTKDQMANIQAYNTPMWDSAFLMIFAGLTLFIIVSAFFIDTHPIFFIITVLGLIGLYIATPIISNIFYDISMTDGIYQIANGFVYIPYIMNHLLEIVIAQTFIALIALYAKFNIGG